MILTILSGLACFILCLFAEATRSEASWLDSNRAKGHGNGGCVYSGSGKVPLLCAACAFLILAAAMVAEHTYLLVVIIKSPPPTILTFDPNSVLAICFTWQAGFFFVANWVCFAVGEFLLLFGVSVESGHLREWWTPKSSCLVAPRGLFSAAGILGLATVFFSSGLSLTAWRGLRLFREQESVRREVLATSVLYASPPLSPPPRNGNPTSGRQHQNEQPRSLVKQSNLV